MVGEDSASKVYVKTKSNACMEIGIEYEEYLLQDNITQKELINLIEKLNNDDNINGILLQSPIPKHLDIDEAFRTISAKKDVDGFNPINVGKLLLNQDTFVSDGVRFSISRVTTQIANIIIIKTTATINGMIFIFCLCFFMFYPPPESFYV